MADPKKNPEDESLLTGAFGVSDEDQLEIIAQIDQVAQQNRIQVGPELFAVKARKKGIFAPFIINVGAACVLALGLLGLYFLFQQSVTTSVSEGRAFSSAEGKLLQELKKEAEGRLQAKDEEIANIQNRLTNIDKERLDLQTNFDSKVRTKEMSLREQMNQELETERARLRAQGLSEAVIAERLNKFKQEQEARFQKEFQTYTQRAQQEKAALEANLKKTQDDYQRALNETSQERKRIMAEAQKKETELKAQLEEKNKAADAQSLQTKAQLDTAVAELTTLNQQKEKLNTFETQIAGFYTGAAKSIQARKFTEAAAGIKALKSYLADPSVVALASMQQRREADLALVSILEDSINSEVRRIEADSAKLGRTDDTVDTIKTLVAAADKEFSTGNIPKAEEYYLQALAKIPEVLASHEYFLKKKLLEEQAKQDKLNQGLIRAEQAYNAGRYQEAVNFYNLALEATPMGAVQRDAFLGRVQEAGYQILKPLRTPAPAPTPAPVSIPKTAFADAEKLMTEKRYDEAIGVYVGILEKYPGAVESTQVLASIRQASASHGTTVTSGITAAQLAKLQDDKAELEKKLAALEKQQSASNQEKSVLDSKITELKAEVANLKKNQAVIATTANPQTDPSNPDKPVLTKEVEEEIARLNAVVAEYQRIQDSYKVYTTQEDKVLKTGSDSAKLMEARSYLETFLSSEDMRKTFPGINDRIGRYEIARQEVGQKEILFNITDVVTNLGKLNTPVERTAYLKTAQRRYQGNKAILEFLAGLESLLKVK